MYNSHESSRSKKRPRICIEPSPEVSTPAAKKKKATTEQEVYCGHRPPRFWDTLSKVRLSRGAVREFDRRILQTERGRQRLPVVSSSSARDIQQVARFSRHGGPDLAHLRGFACLHSSNDSMSNSSSQSRKRSSVSGRSDLSTNARSSPYNGDFEQKLVDAGIYPEGHEYPDNQSPIEPTNMDDIQRALREPRASLSPSRFSEAAFRDFRRETTKAANEADAMANVIPIIVGEGRTKYHSVTDARFTNMSPILEGATAPKPDVYDGAPPERIDPRVRHSIGDHIVPSKNTSLPAAPNFFVEGKSAGGRADVAKRQACYDGAVGARAMHSLQNYGAPKPQYDGKAYSYSNTYHNGTGTLQIYGSHPTPPQAPGGQPNYHMTQINSYAMTGNVRSFREGATAIRNLRDLAKTHRDNFIDLANHAGRHAPPESSSTTLTGSRASLSVLHEGESDTSADELAYEEITIKRTRHMSPAQSKHDSVTSRQVTTATSKTIPQSTPRHWVDNSVTPHHTTTRTSNVTPHASTRSQHEADDIAEKSGRRIRASQKTLGSSRHASDARD